MSVFRFLRFTEFFVASPRCDTNLPSTPPRCGQTLSDPRPNKALRPWLYRAHLASYPDLDLLCLIATHSVIPPWKDPSSRFGLRPVPANYIGVITGATVVTDKLLADYYKAVALSPPWPLSNVIPGPDGQSINAQTSSEDAPDASWDPFVSIARRIRDLQRRYPGYAIYAMIADIADAFHHVPIHADHASAFGGRLPRTSHGIVSGMAVFGWTSSPGFFAVFGKAVRHYQRTGHSIVLGNTEPFWSFQWVDDIVLIEVDLGDRLMRAEKRLRDGVKLVFGSEGWHEGKFTTWSRVFHAVGIDWNIPESRITVPQRKMDKLKSVLSETLKKSFLSKKRLDSVIGVLRHLISFVPVTKPFIQRLTAVQNRCRMLKKNGVPMASFLRKDLE
ncbi:unnamed protein product [Phytophthora fragariaefolia]|uniref:Unnamed protein product n=1 Tax=Phytophthora fragariaefolia TaxID=1490495 RepID=A0A9W6Y8Z3_9STRA|nr:unnamed protein product [Phytophthora fragariaefolia]